MNIRSKTAWTRPALATYAQANKRDVVDLTRRLLSKLSENPPGDTRSIAEEIVSILTEAQIDVKMYPSAEHIHNVVARVRGTGSGPRLILNGHLDTFPIGQGSNWTVPPTGLERDGSCTGLASLT